LIVSRVLDLSTYESSSIFICHNSVEICKEEF